MSVSCAELPYELVHSHYMIRITQENSSAELNSSGLTRILKDQK